MASALPAVRAPPLWHRRERGYTNLDGLFGIVVSSASFALDANDDETGPSGTGFLNLTSDRE